MLANYSYVIDPPYNTGADTDFLYKDIFKHSAWLSLMNDRIRLGRDFLSETGSMFAQIDDYEEHRLRELMDLNFGSENKINKINWVRTFNSGSSKGLSKKLPSNLDTIYWYSKSKNYGHIKQFRPYSEGALKRYDKVDEHGARFKWNPMKTYSQEKLKRLIASGDAMWTETSKYPVYKKYLDESKGAPLDNNWSDISSVGTNSPERTGFITQKPTKLLERCIKLADGKLTLDFFGGSATTAHAVMNLNKEDKGNRKFILFEMGEQFENIQLPRIKKHAYCSNWKNDAAVKNKTGSEIFVKYVELESYEDVLSNIDLKKTNEQQSLLGDTFNSSFKEQYTLKYMIDMESKNQLIDFNLFNSPLNSDISIVRNNQQTKRTVDLVETFNYLLGLSVKTIRKSKGIVEVIGTTNNGDKCLILWRDIFETTNDQLDEWFKKQDYNSRDMEFDLIYVNGDNNLPNLKTGTDHWKVQLIETEFYKLMFDVNEL